MYKKHFKDSTISTNYHLPTHGSEARSYTKRFPKLEKNSSPIPSFWTPSPDFDHKSGVLLERKQKSKNKKKGKPDFHEVRAFWCFMSTKQLPGSCLTISEGVPHRRKETQPDTLSVILF